MKDNNHASSFNELYGEIERCRKAIQIGPDNSEAYYNWGRVLQELAVAEQPKPKELLYREACEKYSSAVRLDPSSIYAISNLGVVLTDLAYIRHDKSLFEKACENFEQVVHLNPNIPEVFNNWGRALFHLARIENDNESLLLKSLEKYEESIRLKSDYAPTFMNWGATLSRLAFVKQDELLFKESFEKYAKYASLLPNTADVYYSWAIAIAELAYVKQDASLFKEAFEKYRKAAEIEPENTYIYHNWGITLCKLTEIKLLDSLFNEELTYFENIIGDINTATTFLILWKLYVASKQFDKAKNSFKKSKMNILNILTFLEKDGIWDNTLEPFYTLLDVDTNDGLFFHSIIKDTVDKEMLDKYKKAYILSMKIISLLWVENKNEKIVAHYLSKATAEQILFDNESFRLCAINYSNDPTEGKILLDYLFGKMEGNSVTLEEDCSEYRAFAGCFTFNHDSLNQFRLYGKENGSEGVGVSLVFCGSYFSTHATISIPQMRGSYFVNVVDEMPMSQEYNSITENNQRLALFRCVYIDPDSQNVVSVGHKEEYLFYKDKATAYRYIKNITEITQNVQNAMAELKELVSNLEPDIIKRLLVHLCYFTKHVAFKEEQECRVVKIHRLDDDDVKDYSGRMFVMYEPKVVDYIEKIYFGPKSVNIELFKDILKRRNLNIPCEKSKNPLA